MHTNTHTCIHTEKIEKGGGAEKKRVQIKDILMSGKGKQATEHLLQVSPQTARETVVPPFTTISHLSCFISRTHTQHNMCLQFSPRPGCIHLDGIKVEFSACPRAFLLHPFNVDILHRCYHNITIRTLIVGNATTTHRYFPPFFNFLKKKFG